jgi:hypothetical protein
MTREILMDIDEEIESLGLPEQKESLVWDARAKITWGERPDDVHTGLLAGGINRSTADGIMEVLLRERAMAMRAKGVLDLVLGLGAIGVALVVGLGAIMSMRDGAQGVRLPTKLLALITALSFLAFMFGLNRTWRGIERLVGGSRAEGAVSDVDDS